MNAYPYNNGHMLISPYRHVAKFEELSDEEMLEITTLIKKAIGVVRKLIHPHGFNIGVNQGKAAGSSFDHIHFHLLPRWNGDTNFMPTLADAKVIHEHLSETYRRFYKEFRTPTKK
jgi:ATP adenylyltransferase